jgi:multidrug resistance efflux pump
MNYAARNGLLLSRIDRHAAHPAAAELRKAAENCFTVAQSYADFCDELAQDRFLTADGKRAKLAEARTKYEREMETARAPIDSAAKGVERLRGQIKLAPIDRTDAVAEMRRAELRTYMRSLTSRRRIQAGLRATRGRRSAGCSHRFRASAGDH